jgi:hypothetical protein
MHGLLISRADMDIDLEGLHTDAGVFRGQPLEIGLVLQYFHCRRYMGRTARTNTRLQREIHFFRAIGLQLAILFRLVPWRCGECGLHLREKPMER